jgi:hypothetical protein
LKPGAAYDPLYTANFLTNNTALRSLAGYVAGFQAAADSQTHLVDLTINSFTRAVASSRYFKLPVTPLPTVSGWPF